MSMENQQLDAHRVRVEVWLRDCFREREPRGDLYDAMYYSLMAGGKRIRPVLLMETCRICGGDPETVLPFAGAIEMIHTYSLIHDDLPCMDDDDLRRGRPTNHKVYGEATAVLAGDGLLTAAFEAMLDPSVTLPSERVLEAAGILARAAGGRGMVGGQVLDMAGEGHSLGLQEVEELQRLKTGALIAAAAEMGCVLAGSTSEQRQAARRYAERIGLAFQIQDDILDVVGDEATLGKPVGSDAKSEKNTFVTLKGLDACRDLVDKLTREAVEALSCFGPDREGLCGLAQALASRRQGGQYAQCSGCIYWKPDPESVHSGLGHGSGNQIHYYADYQTEAGLAAHPVQRRNAQFSLRLCMCLCRSYGIYVRLGLSCLYHFCSSGHCGHV